MIYGVGSDLVTVARIDAAMHRFGDRFARRLLADGEWADFAASRRPAQFLAKRFAAKEALAKALGTGIRAPVTWQNISVIHNPLGKPGFDFAAALEQFVRNAAIRAIHLSITDERELACAFVVLEQ